MDSKNISKLLRKTSNNKSMSLSLLDELPIGKNKDTTSREIFGVITQKQRKLVRKLIKGKVKNKTEKHEAKHLVIDLLRFYASLNNKANNIENFDYKHQINRIFKTTGIALEFFLLDYLDRSRNISGKFEKGPAFMDPHKIDFFYNQDDIRYGIQLTNTKSPKVNSKHEDMVYLQHAIDNNGAFISGKKSGSSIEFYSKNMLTKENISPNFIPDIGVLVVINIDFKNKTQNKKIAMFSKAFNSWQENGYCSKGPSHYLPNKIKKDFEYIADTYPYIMQEFDEIMQIKNSIKTPWSYKKLLPEGKGEIFISIDSEDKIVTFECFNNIQNPKFIYRMSFYITKKYQKKVNAYKPD